MSFGADRTKKAALTKGTAEFLRRSMSMLTHKGQGAWREGKGAERRIDDKWMRRGQRRRGGAILDRGGTKLERVTTIS